MTSEGVKMKEIPLSMFLQHVLLGQWKVYQKNAFCCEIKSLQNKLVAQVCLKMFDDYPILKTNNWSWGDTDNLITKKLKNITQNGSRRIIGEIEYIQYSSSSMLPPCGVRENGSEEMSDVKKLLFDLARAIARSLEYRVIVIPVVFEKYFTGNSLPLIYPKGMKQSSYYVYLPGNSGKEKMIRIQEVDYYVDSSCNQHALLDIEICINNFAKKNQISISKLTKTEPKFSAQQLYKCMALKPLYSGQMDLFNLQRQQDGADGFFAMRKGHIVGVTLFTAFQKDDYPPPISKGGHLDKADPIFFSDTKKNENITEKIYRGYNLHILYTEKKFGRILLARVLFELRKYHGRVVTLIAGKKENPIDDENIYKEFGFHCVQVRFSVRFGGATWKMQINPEDKIEEPIWMSLMVNSSKQLITLDSVQKILF